MIHNENKKGIKTYETYMYIMNYIYIYIYIYKIKNKEKKNFLKIQYIHNKIDYYNFLICFFHYVPNEIDF